MAEAMQALADRERENDEAADARRGEETDLIQRARELVPLLRANMAKADTDRRLPQENIDALVDAGLFRTWVPRRYGGYEAPVKDALRVSAELAYGCPATAWNVSMMNAVCYLAGMLSSAGQDDIFGGDVLPRFAGVFNPKPESPARPVDGGYVVSGAWPFASGCLHSDWSLLPAPLLDESGQMVNGVLLFAPTSELQIKDTWHVLGMRGTGSNTLVADELFVPTRRTLTMLGPDGIMESSIPSEFREEEALYRVPIGLLAGAVTGIACLGLARAARDYVVERLPKRTVAYSNRLASEAVPTQLLVGEAATQIDLAAALFERLADDLDAAGNAGGPPSDIRLRARARNDAGYAVDLCRRAVDNLVMASGASSMADGSPLQQWHRDMRTASLHATTLLTTTLEQYGAALCAQPPTASFMI